MSLPPQAPTGTDGHDGTDDRSRPSTAPRSAAPAGGTASEGSRPPTVKAGRREGKPSQADLLVALADELGSPVRDQTDTVYFETEIAGGGRDLMRVNGEAFHAWLAHQFAASFGKTPSRGAISDTARVLTGRARVQPPVPVFVRVAVRPEARYLDLANSERDVVRITADGWEIVRGEGPLFVRPKGLLPLPRPERGGSLDDLKALINVDDKQFVLVAAFAVAALAGEGPYPVLVLVGEQGSAKSAQAIFIRSLVDPHACPLRSVPRDERDLAVAASNSHVIALDNLSLPAMPQWLSDGLCRLASGGGFATRALYTDGDEAIFTYQRPIILTSIDQIAERADLGDRALLLTLDPIADGARKQERHLHDDFKRRHPSILGALMDAVSCALARLPTIALTAPPRLADFATFVTAAEPALGWPDGAFMDAYRENKDLASRAALDGDPITLAIRILLEKRSHWTGTATDLLAELGRCVDDETRRSFTWPRAANKLSNRLRRVAPALRAAGINVDQSRSPTTREITLLKTTPVERHHRH